MTTQNQGIAFNKAADGTQSTTKTGAGILAAALKPLNPAHAEAVLQERHWRRKYPTHFRQLVEGGIASPEAALQSAKAGLNAAWDGLRWDVGDEQISLRDAMNKPTVALKTLTLKGRALPRLRPGSCPLRASCSVVTCCSANWLTG